jgi:hypothetical protein
MSCGDNKLLFTQSRCQHIKQLHVSGDYHKCRDQEKDMIEQTAMANLTKKILVVPINTKLSYCTQQSFQQCCVGAEGSK